MKYRKLGFVFYAIGAVFFGLYDSQHESWMLWLSVIGFTGLCGLFVVNDPPKKYKPLSELQFDNMACKDIFHFVFGDSKFEKTLSTYDSILIYGAGEDPPHLLIYFDGFSVANDSEFSIRHMNQFKFVRFVNSLGYDLV